MDADPSEIERALEEEREIARLLALLDHPVPDIDVDAILKAAPGIQEVPGLPDFEVDFGTELSAMGKTGAAPVVSRNLDDVFAASTNLEPALGHLLPSRYVRARLATVAGAASTSRA